MKKKLESAIAFACAVVILTGAQAQAQENHWKALTDLEFPGGYPTKESSARLFDELDFQRAVQVYLWALPAMNIDAMRQGSEAVFGAGNHILPVWKDRLNTKTKVTTPNSDVVYAMSYLDLKDGPVVVEVPAKLQGMFCNFWHRPICDVGFVGPDKGKGGKYLLLPPGFKGKAPDGYFTFTSATYRVFLFWRGFLVDGKTDQAVEIIEQTRVYPLGKMDSAPRMVFPNASEKESNMLVTQDISYFENLKEFIDYEPTDREDFAMRGMMATLGMVKGEPFQPDARMKAILNRAADVAWKMASVQRYERRLAGTRRYEDRQFDEGFIGGSEVFEADTYLNLDSRTSFFRFAYSSSPAMVVDMVGKGSKYPLTFKDGDGDFLMGGNTYKFHLPKGIPAENFWAVTLYNAPTAAGVDKPGQMIPSLSSQGDVKYNDDRSVDLYFGPKRPDDAPASNYIGTNEGEGFFVILRLYSPGKAYFDKTWKPDDIVKIASGTGVQSPETIKTRIGDLSFTHDFANGYPTDGTVEKLFDEMDFQRACQAYIWSLPIVSMAQWQYAHNEQLGAENGQIVLFESYDDKLGGLTFNATTPYALPFIDLADGPWVAAMPDGEVRGAAHDMWQIGITQITEPGKYLFVGPGQETPADAKAGGFRVFQSPTNSLLLGIRLMPKERDARMAILEKIAIYPYAERKNPKPRGYITPNGKPWLAAQPRGMEYWERLADVISREPIAERDRFFLAMLQPLGIEKGKPFKPDARQKEILTQATLVGEAMAKANDFAKRMEDAHYVDGSHWDFATVCPPDQRRENHDSLDGRAAWFYEAVTNDVAMHGQKTGKGQVYMGAYKDEDGDWLDGGTNYVLNVPANAPAEAFWSITLYDVDTRCLIENEQKIADRSSRMDLLENRDGSITIYIGPDKPAGDKARNWIPTVAGKAWFPYFRLYSPKKAFLDRTWILPDIERAN